MKVIMVMFDSLNKHMLPPYGNDWVVAPNFKRLAENSVVFDNCFAGSLPCMPARREIHTGRYNFLHRSWGPLEPFDNSMPEILKNNGIYTHLISDHYHYWEDGGATYHTKYSSWEISRGQEGDPWKGVVGNIDIPHNINKNSPRARQDWVNRIYMQNENLHPQNKTFNLGLEFIEKNHSEDNWFLQIETFDPHEPYFTYKKFEDLYPHNYNGPLWDWPEYKEADKSDAEIRHIRYKNAALISMCDENLGKVLDLMDKYNLWRDTMLIVNTDHGFLLGEHNWFGKSVMPLYNEIVNIPFFIYHPEFKVKGERRGTLVQTIDIAPTILDFFNVKIPDEMLGKSLKETIKNDKKVREYALFGVHGGHINITDGKFVYMRAPVNDDGSPLFEYTLMPAHMQHSFSVEELQNIELSEPFNFTKGCKLMKIPAFDWRNLKRFGNLLFDLEKDPAQMMPVTDKNVEKLMLENMIKLMKENDAPEEQYVRVGIEI